MTAIVMGYYEQKVKMITFITLDCSPLLLHSGSITGRSPLRNGIFLDFKIISNDTFITNTRLVPLEPLELNFERYNLSVFFLIFSFFFFNNKYSN